MTGLSGCIAGPGGDRGDASSTDESTAGTGPEREEFQPPHPSAAS